MNASFERKSTVYFRAQIKRWRRTDFAESGAACKLNDL